MAKKTTGVYVSKVNGIYKFKPIRTFPPYKLLSKFYKEVIRINGEERDGKKDIALLRKIQCDYYVNPNSDTTIIDKIEEYLNTVKN